MPRNRPSDISARKLPAVALHIRARNGDSSARDQLLAWAYATALHYYYGKVDLEAHFTRADADELTCAFVLEFQRAWPRMRLVVHYTRRMLKNNLQRHLRRKRVHAQREVTMAHHELVARVSNRHHTGQSDADSAWNDSEWHQYQAVRHVLAQADPLTRKLMELRCAEPQASYREIAGQLGASENALRMRATRFYRAVRETYQSGGARVTSGCAMSSDSVSPVQEKKD